MDMDGEWSWANIGQEKLHEVREFLGKIETMDWNALRGDRAHTVAKWKISNDAQRRLEEIGQDDVDDLLSLRKSGPERIWGIKDREILKLLWWDPNHTVYPVEKKHT